ncbi:MAG TPA: cell division protein ZapA [Stellaceae bacterium]|nr:cell division protein ZapA [Stellaceae bacterium]
MPQVTVTINGHPHAVQCDPGEEHRIRDLARLVDAKVASFADQSARAGEARLLVLAALLLADELTEASDALRRLNARAAASVDDPALADGIDQLTRRIEAVALRLETPHI